MQSKDLLTLREVADLVGCSYHNVYQYARFGTISTVKYGKSIFVKHENIDEVVGIFKRKSRKKSI